MLLVFLEYYYLFLIVLSALTEKILNLAIFRQEKCLKSPKLNIFLVRFCQKVPIIYKICMVGAYSRWALIQARTVLGLIEIV